MFYSHEILTSRQYGVSTVWLVATVGVNSTAKKLTRKVIQDVNVPKACDTIIEPPGAPIALRLQGNLLYGVSAVYSKQSTYLLSDAEKIQMDLRTFHHAAKNENIDMSAGKSKRQQLVVADDPAFVPDFTLPALNFDLVGNLAPDISRWTLQASSQMSSIGRSKSASSPGKFINLDLRHSSSSYRSRDMPSPFAFGSELGKPGNDTVPMVFGEEEDLAFGDFGLAVDAEGNIIEEPQLPALPGPRVAELPDDDDNADVSKRALPEDDEGIVLGDDDQTVLHPVQPLPEAEALPPRKKAKLDESDGSNAIVALQRKKRMVKKVTSDETTRIGHAEFRQWQDIYVAKEDAKRAAAYAVKPVDAKANAFNAIFGVGLAATGSLGNLPGVEHSLFEDFAGHGLRELLTGIPPPSPPLPRGRRRSSSATLREDGSDADDRRVRARLDENEEHRGRGVQEHQEDDMGFAFGDDIEIGRAPGSALSDHLSSVPWNRPGSAVPSTIQSYKSAQAMLVAGRAVPESPLVGRGNILPDIERYSDIVAGSDGFAPVGGLHNSSSSDHGAGIAAHSTSHLIQTALDREGRHFRDYVERVGQEKGYPDYEVENRTWVGFDDLFEPADQTRPVVTQAFYQLLSLVTKGELKVEQAGIAEKTPFGQIEIGYEPLPTMPETLVV